MMDKGKEFESSLAELSAITGISGKDLEVLGKNALDTSITYGVAASEIIQANKLVASQLAEKIDFGTTEGMRELQEVSEQAVVLAQASGETLSTAVQTTTTVLNQFNLEASETNRIINSIAAGAKFGAAEAQQQSEAYREAGSVFAAANREFEELNASTQILALNAIHGSRAGTGLRNMMVILQSEADKLAKYGINDVNVKTESFSETLRKLKPLLTDTNALSEIFGRENITVAQILIKNAEVIEQMNEKVRGTKTAYEQSETRMGTYQGAIDRLQSAIDSRLIPAFQETNGVMIRGIGVATEWIIKIGAAVDWMNQNLDTSKDLTVGLRSELDRMSKSIKEIGGLTDSQAASYGKSVEAMEGQLKTLKILHSEQDRRTAEYWNTKAQMAELEQRIIYGQSLLQQFHQESKNNQIEPFDVSVALDAMDKIADRESELHDIRMKQAEERKLRNIEARQYSERIRGQGLGETGIDAAANAAQDQTAQRESELHDERLNRIEEEKLATKNAENAKQKQQITTQKKYEDVTASILTSAALRKGSAADTANAVIDAMFAEIVALAIKSVMEAVPFPLNLAAAGGAAGVAAGMRSLIPEFADGGPIGYSTGGPIYGPGTSRSDSVPIMASRGEYMMNARSTKAIGVHRMNMMNRSPGFAQSVAGMIDRLPSLKADSVNLDSVENALGSSGGESFSDKAIISKLDDVASRIENMEVNAFIDYNSFKKDLAKLDNIQKEMGKG